MLGIAWRHFESNSWLRCCLWTFQVKFLWLTTILEQFCEFYGWDVVAAGLVASVALVASPVSAFAKDRECASTNSQHVNPIERVTYQESTAAK